MRIVNRDRISHTLNLGSLGGKQETLTLAPGEESKELKKETVEASSEVKKLVAWRRLKLIERSTSQTETKKEKKKDEGGKK